jgi:shikimate kinase
VTAPTGGGQDDHVLGHGHALAQRRFKARSVAVVGFMGVGKTSVGRELARLLDRPFVDTDYEVETRSGRTIPELFAEGEPVFRKLERACLLEALDRPPCVIALGGGAFSQPGAAELLLERALVVHLHIPWSAMLPLLPILAGDRPLIGSRAPWEVQELFLARAESYRRAHVRVCLQRTDVASAAQTVAGVLMVDHPHGNGLAVEEARRQTE